MADSLINAVNAETLSTEENCDESLHTPPKLRYPKKIKRKSAIIQVRKCLPRFNSFDDLANYEKQSAPFKKKNQESLQKSLISILSTMNLHKESLINLKEYFFKWVGTTKSRKFEIKQCFSLSIGIDPYEEAVRLDSLKFMLGIKKTLMEAKYMSIGKKSKRRIRNLLTTLTLRHFMKDKANFMKFCSIVKDPNFEMKKKIPNNRLSKKCFAAKSLKHIYYRFLKIQFIRIVSLFSNYQTRQFTQAKFCGFLSKICTKVLKISFKRIMQIEKEEQIKGVIMRSISNNSLTLIEQTLIKWMITYHEMKHYKKYKCMATSAKVEKILHRIEIRAMKNHFDQLILIRKRITIRFVDNYYYKLQKEAIRSIGIWKNQVMDYKNNVGEIEKLKKEYAVSKVNSLIFSLERANTHVAFVKIHNYSSSEIMNLRLRSIRRENNILAVFLFILLWILLQVYSPDFNDTINS